MNRTLIGVLVLVLTLVLLIVGCSSSAPKMGKLAPDFQLPNLEAQAISLSDFQGKPVFLNFWATWCGPCRYEMPLIQAMFEKSSGTGLVILAVDVGEAPSRVKDYLQSGNFSFPVLLDTKQDVALGYNVRGLPTTFLIDKDGIIKEVKVGAFLNMLEINKSVAKIIP